MFNSLWFDLRTSQVTVKFWNGAHSIPLWEGATLAELAVWIDTLGAKLSAAEIPIDIEFVNCRPSSMGQLQPAYNLTY